MNRENPYNRLKRISRQWIFDNVLYRRRRTMFVLDLANKKYDLSHVTAQIETASILGYGVELSLNADGKVVFEYVEKLPERMPLELN